MLSGLKSPVTKSHSVELHSCNSCPTIVMHCLTTGICFEKCVVRQFHRPKNVIDCTYTNLDSIAYYTPRLYGIAYCS